MSATVMQVREVAAHPNADTLFVYQMEDINKQMHTIVANNTRTYEVGDNVIVALPGSKLKEDNIYIEEANIRGVTSKGMALGKTEFFVGSDLTNEYCQKNFHISWPDIESLFNVRKNMLEPKAIFYGAKTKLDGTCAAVQVFPDGTLIVQSRSCIITPESDNIGFARWVQDSNAFESLKPNAPFTIFGEWCGKGIQKRCSISQIDRKVFCVFAIQYGSKFDVNPKTIRAALPQHDDVFVIPFYKHILVNYENKELLEQQVAIMNEWVADVEKCDPFVKDTFNIEGLGEGLVMYPLAVAEAGWPSLPEIHSDTQMFINRSEYIEYVFKAKGAEHKVVKTKEAVQIDPEVAANIDEFVTLFVTPARLEQIANKVGPFDMKKTGEFLKQFSADVIKESTAELEASNMTWKDVSGGVSTAARQWWMANCNKV